ncbi:MAG TPA: hypothetical protein VFM18_22145 [Methanosarcina sp.]|nr:hypothetical protein [Methanosarcina sp.]
MNIDKIEHIKKLFEYATPKQQVKLELVIKHRGNVSAASAELGIDESAIRKLIKRLSHIHSKMQSPTSALNPNETPVGFSIDRISKHIDKEGNVSGWVIANRDKEDQFNAMMEAIDNIASSLDGKIPEIKQMVYSDKNLMNNYISNDLHIGALMWGKETGDKDYDLNEAQKIIRDAIDYLLETSPKVKYGVISDLGDMLEIDDFKNSTPKSGHSLDVDGRYSKILTVAIDAMIYMIEKALQYHEKVFFINIAGNHDISTGHAIRESMRVAFRNNPRVIIDNSPRPQKYILFGQTIIGYAHGDGQRMNQSDGVMTSDCIEHISQTRHREYHYGHTHKDAVYDGVICRSESHRNIAPLNGWASHNGYRRGIGTMKSITYCPLNGRKSVNIFNVDMEFNSTSEYEPILLQ